MASGSISAHTVAYRSDSSPPAIICRAPDEVTYTPGRRSVFLAGSIDPTPGIERWHIDMTRRLAHLPITILDPWRDDWDSTWVERESDQRFASQTQWELENQERADLVAVYFHPKSEAPVSFLELGLAVARGSGKVVVCCPEDFYRRGNVEIVCGRYGVKLADTYEEFVRDVIEKLERQ